MTKNLKKTISELNIQVNKNEWVAYFKGESGTLFN